MNSVKMKEKWLEEGYKQFAAYGPEILSINNISKAIGASRASFYHHFGDTEVFIDELLTMHWNIAVDFSREGKDCCTQLFPDFYDYLARFPVPLQFSLQLFRHRTNPTYNFLFIKAYELTAKSILLDLFAQECNLEQPPNELLKLWITVGEAWYSRLNPEDLSASTLQKHAKEILNTVIQFSDSRLYSTIRANQLY